MLPLLLGNQDKSVQMGPEVRVQNRSYIGLGHITQECLKCRLGHCRGGQEECIWEQDLHVVNRVIQEFSCLPVVYTLYILYSIAQ